MPSDRNQAQEILIPSLSMRFHLAAFSVINAIELLHAARHRLCDKTQLADNQMAPQQWANGKLNFVVTGYCISNVAQ